LFLLAAPPPQHTHLTSFYPFFLPLALQEHYQHNIHNYALTPRFPYLHDDARLTAFTKTPCTLLDFECEKRLADKAFRDSQGKH
jgi:hypothetical protein